MTHRTLWPCLLTALSLAGCEKPAPVNPPAPANPLVGHKWSTTNMNQWPHPVGLKAAVEFGNDGRIRNYTTFREGETCNDCEAGKETTYTVSGTTLTCALKGYSPVKMEYAISGDSLTLTIVDQPDQREFNGVKYIYETKEK